MLEGSRASWYYYVVLVSCFFLMWSHNPMKRKAHSSAFFIFYLNMMWYINIRIQNTTQTVEERELVIIYINSLLITKIIYIIYLILCPPYRLWARLIKLYINIMSEFVLGWIIYLNKTTEYIVNYCLTAIYILCTYRVVVNIVTSK